MKPIKSILMAVLICILFSGVGLAEYYQYKDEEGNLHFTDNRGQVPEDQQEAIEKFESVEARPKFNTPARKGSPEPARRTTPDSRTWDGQLQITAEQLDTEKQALDQRFHDLQEEKADLLKQSTENMSSDELSAHKDRIHVLNDRIEQYEEACAEFQEKVDRFNVKIKQKKEKAASSENE